MILKNSVIIGNTIKSKTWISVDYQLQLCRVPDTCKIEVYAELILRLTKDL